MSIFSSVIYILISFNIVVYEVAVATDLPIASPAAFDRVVVRYADLSASGHEKGLQGLEIVPLEDGEPVHAALHRLNARSDILYAEPDYQVNALLEPNDDRWSLQWGPQASKVNEAWNTSTGDSSVIVCVIDTGIDYTHAELTANMHPLQGWNVVKQQPDPMDDNGHGTHCAGVIGAAANNNAGIAGINWNVQLLGCKFMDAQGVGYLSGILSCLDYCVQHNATISSNSYALEGLDRRSSILKDAISQAGQKDHLFVAAAGNSGEDNDADTRPSFPSAFATSNMISVAALEQGDGAGDEPRLATYSNYGATTVHIAAPGSQILSTWPGNWLAYLTGTSMATPHVAAIAALLKGATKGQLTNMELREAILATTKPLTPLSGKVVTGGMADAGAAITRAMELLANKVQRNQTASTMPPPPPPPLPLSSDRLDPSAPWNGIEDDGSGIFQVSIQVSGFSCLAFHFIAQRTFTSALRVLSGGVVRDIRTTCRSPSLFGSDRSLHVNFRVAMSQGQDMVRAANNLYQALTAEDMAMAVLTPLGRRYKILSFSVSSSTTQY